MMFLRRLICLLPLVVLVGCASGYHCYPCGQVSCSYCPPNPLPYSVPDTCNCNDSIGQRHLADMHAGMALVEPLHNSQNASDLDYYVVPPGK